MLKQPEPMGVRRPGWLAEDASVFLCGVEGQLGGDEKGPDRKSKEC